MAADPFKDQARELQEFADVRYTEALGVVRGDRWPDATVRAPACLVAEWCALRGMNKTTRSDDRLCNCVECKLHDQKRT